MVKGDEDIFRGIRVKVLTPKGNEVTIFNVHLSPRTTDGIGDAQAEWVLEQARPYLDRGEYVVITGDFNYNLTDPYLINIEPRKRQQGPLIYSRAGLITIPEGTGIPDVMVNYICAPQCWSGGPISLTIDQVWVPSRNMGFLPLDQGGDYFIKNLAGMEAVEDEASDHRPEGAPIVLYPNP